MLTQIMFGTTGWRAAMGEELRAPCYLTKLIHVIAKGRTFA